MTTTKTTPTTVTDTTIAADACRQLAPTGLAPALDELCDQATRRRLSHSTFLAEALQIELDIRNERGRTRRIHGSASFARSGLLHRLLHHPRRGDEKYALTCCDRVRVCPNADSL